MEHDLLAVDDVPKPEAAKREPPLTFARLHTYELLDAMCPGAVVRVGLKDVESALLEKPEFGMASAEALNEAIEVRRGVDGIRRRHVF